MILQLPGVLSQDKRLAVGTTLVTAEFAINKPSGGVVCPTDEAQSAVDGSGRQSCR